MGKNYIKKEKLYNQAEQILLKMEPNAKLQTQKRRFHKPLYSPRTTYSNHCKQVNLLKINMIINIDKYILGNLKNEFEKRGHQINKLQLIYFAKKYLKDWNPQLYGRQVKIQECLLEIWKQIDIQNKGKVTWEEFNSKIIQTGLNLKSLSNNAGFQAPSFKQLVMPFAPAKHEHPIAKIIYLKNKNKMAFFRDQSIGIDFFSTEPQKSDYVPTKPLIIPQQQLKVKTMVKVKNRNQKNQKNKVSKNIKKDVMVSSYKNTVIDAIFIEDPKYDILMVSCSDKYIRGYNVSNVNPVIATQPQNQDQTMIHQFPVEIYCMAWDSVNQVLYATGKHQKIYQWLIKTDSERQMDDIKGHQKMVSCLYMMPKLQLLASGGYDGKLILWDTVGQVLKCRYEEHTRAISGLILLFTASYDHKICIWNPYITSLIHKIQNNLNIISIEIIPNTNYLVSLDCGGNVKVRQTNRFTQITTFSIFRGENSDENQKLNKATTENQKQVSICMGSKNDGFIQYYFGTDKIIGYEYFQIQKSSIHGGTNLCHKYQQRNFSMYTPVKNHISVWNLLAGKVEQIFYDMAQNDISAFEIVEDLNIFIVGDVQGNLIQRKTNNGFFIKSLHKFKSAITCLTIHEVQRNQKQKNIKIIYLLFCGTEQGEIAVFRCHPKTQFELYRFFSLKKDFNIGQTASMNEIQYFGQKNILIACLSSNQVVFIDIQKKSLLVKLQIGKMSISSISIINSPLAHYFVILSKSSCLTGFYLPPNPRKFKTSCNYILQDIQKVECSIYGQKSESFYILNQSNQLYCLKLNKKYLDSESSKTIQDSNNSSFRPEWKIKLENRVKKMILIQNEQILILLNQTQNFTFISVQNGQIICNLKQEKRQNYQNQEPEPIIYYKEKTQQLYIPNLQNVIKIYEDEIEKHRIQRIVDPSYFLNLLKQKNVKNFRKQSNPHWQLQLNFKTISDKRIKQLQQIQLSMGNLGKQFQKKGLFDNQKKISKAIQLQRKWQKQKDPETETLKNINMIQTRQNRNSLHLNPPITRGSSLGSLWKFRQSIKKTQISMHDDRFNHKQVFHSKDKHKSIQNIDFSKIKNDPLYRLGLALKSVNDSDKKAQNFIELARKKQAVRFPKIKSQKIKH